jgi:NAD(P)-dependent dehydrogenase (short-subunit alcohol dehydrogenase family)
VQTTPKLIVITGATAGIGLAAARALCARGAQVIGIGRSAERCAQAEQLIRAETPAADIRYHLADLSSLRQVRALAAGLCAELPRLDVLINNAGTVASGYTATEDNYELQFAVNHLAPFLLTRRLLPLLRAAPDARVVTVSSASHRSGRIHWQDVMLRQRYNPLTAYQQSKVANVLFSAEFNRRYTSPSLRAYAADPGLVNTDIGLKGTQGLVRWFWNLRRGGGQSPPQGAATAVHLASQVLDGQRGALYWADCRPAMPSKYALRADEAARLWQLSLRLCGEEGA